MRKEFQDKKKLREQQHSQENDRMQQDRSNDERGRAGYGFSSVAGLKPFYCVWRDNHASSIETNVTPCVADTILYSTISDSVDSEQWMTQGRHLTETEVVRVFKLFGWGNF